MAWLPKQKVLAPIDFSEASLDAARLARTFVESAQGLHVLHVLIPLAAGDPGVPWEDWTEDRRAEHSLSLMRDKLAEAGLADAEMHIRHGSPGHEITQYAREVGAELIVIPSHGYSGLKHLLLGSVAERVLRHAPCPVLVLRRED